MTKQNHISVNKTVDANAPKQRRVYVRADQFCVGTSTNPKYPCIISGPFNEPPKLMEGHYLYKKIRGKWVRI